MSGHLKPCQSSIFKKQVMGITGLMLCGFLIVHLLGNLLIFVGAEAFNTYAHMLITNPLLIPAEIVLALIFLSHIFMAIKLTIENKKARPVPYYSRQVSGRGSTFASSTMPATGMITLVFLILHIWHIKFGPVYTVTYSGVEMRDLYLLLIEYFSNPIYVIWYVVAVIALGLHVSHGFWSAFQSIGFHHKTYTPKLQIIAKAYAILITVGFASLPIYCYLQGGN
jgi:succinate dehydrogenase / fumarate reductase cytochrome b subunit